ncbi:MAG: TolC family protein [Selenomonadaceae bacterium]|nr:TolC family protein [Selenomonadaceae bacterium]
MKFLRFLVTFLIGIVICLPKTSADSGIINLSLEESIILALNNNRTIEQSKESRENAKWILSRMRRATGATFSWTAAQVHENEATVKRLQSAAVQARESVELDVRKAYNNLTAAEKQIATMKIAVSQAEEDYNIAQIKYAEGVGINLEVMDAQEKLTEARMNYFNAIYNCEVSKAQLEKAMGVPVDIDAMLYVQAEQENKSSDEALTVSTIERATQK